MYKRNKENKQKLELINPMNLLNRGYSIITNKDKGIVKSIHDLKNTKEIKLIFHDGEINIKL